MGRSHRICPGCNLSQAVAYFTLALFLAAWLGLASRPAGASEAQGESAASTFLDLSEPITLAPVVKAPAGTEQAYLITGRIWDELDEGTTLDGIDLERDGATEFAAVYVRYRVLEPAAGGALRLAVHGQLVDARTGAPLAVPAWADVMVIAPDDTWFEGGEIPQWAGVFTESVDWLGSWMSRSVDMPQGPVGPGTAWRSVQDDVPIAWGEGYHTHSSLIEIDGAFIGWARGVTSGSEAPVAVVNERYRGVATAGVLLWELPDDCDRACFEENALFTFDLHVHGDYETWLVPGDFPLGARSAQVMEVTWIGVDIDPIVAYGEVEIRRFEGDVSAPEPAWLAPGEAVEGALGPGSLRRAADGLFVDAPTRLYAFEAVAGEHVLATMSSRAFDPALILLDSAGDYFAGSEFFIEDDTSVAMLYAELPYSGVYYLQASAYSADAGGAYTLSLQVGPDVEHLFEAEWGSGDREFTAGDFGFDFGDDDFGWESDDYYGYYFGIDYTQCETLRSGGHPVNALKYGAPAARTLRAGTDANDCAALPDLFGFTGEAGTEILIQLVSDDFDAYLVLLDDEWTVIEWDDDSAGDLHAQIRRRLPYTGTYFVLAAESPGYSDGEGGAYTLYLDAGDAIPEILSWCGFGRFRTITDLDAPGAAEGYSGYFSSWAAPSGCEPAFELFGFQAEAGDVVTIDAVSTEFDTVLVLTDANLVPLTEDDDSGGAKNARIQTTIGEAGRYYVKLQSYWPGAYGFYTVSLSVNDGPAGPAGAAAGPGGDLTGLDAGAPGRPGGADGLDSMAGGFGAGAPDCYALWEAGALGLVTGDSVTRDAGEAGAPEACAPGRHSYYFDAAAGDEVLVEVYSDAPRTYVALYDGDWDILFEQDVTSGGFADIFDVLPSDGRYYIVAAAYDDLGVPGGYTLYLDFGPALFDLCWTPDTLEIALGESLTFERDVTNLPTYCWGLSDWYVLEGAAGETIELEMTSGSFATFLALYDENEELVDAAGSGDVADEAEGEHRAVITLTLPVTGTYYLEANVTQISEQTAGTYTLRYDRVIEEGFAESIEANEAVDGPGVPETPRSLGSGFGQF